MKEKSVLRRSCLRSRNLIRKKKLKEKKIIKNIECLINENELVISAYYPVRSEVNLLPLIKFLLKKKIRICLPIVYRNNSHLLFKKWDLNCKLVIDKYTGRAAILNKFNSLGINLSKQDVEIIIKHIKANPDKVYWSDGELISHAKSIGIQV